MSDGGVIAAAMMKRKSTIDLTTVQVASLSLTALSGLKYPIASGNISHKRRFNQKPVKASGIIDLDFESAEPNAYDRAKRDNMKEMGL